MRGRGSVFDTREEARGGREGRVGASVREPEVDDDFEARRNHNEVRRRVLFMTTLTMPVSDTTRRRTCVPVKVASS